MSAQATNTEIPLSVEEQKKQDTSERMDFLLSVYPNGVEYSQIVMNIKKKTKYSDAKTRENVDAMLAEMVEEGWIVIKPRRDGSKIVILDKKGIVTINQYMRILKETSKRKYFAWLKAWMNVGDESAKSTYARAAMEIFLQAWEIACMLVSPHFEVHLVDYYARLTGKPADKDTRAFVMDYVGLLVGLGFAKMNTVTDQQSGQPMVSYYFRKEGQDIMRMMFKTISKQGNERIQGMFRPATAPWITWLSLFISFIIVAGIGSSMSNTLESESIVAVIFVSFISMLLPLLISYLIPRIVSLVKGLGRKK